MQNIVDTIDYQVKRDAKKKLRLAYREVAGDIASTLGILEGCSITINAIGNVQPMEDGAFVDCVMWVPHKLGQEKVEELAKLAALAEQAKVDAARAEGCNNDHVWSHNFGDDWTPEVGTPCDCKKKRWGVTEEAASVLLDDDIPF